MELNEVEINYLHGSFPIARTAEDILRELGAQCARDGTFFDAPTGSPLKKRAWVLLRKEIHLLLCTNDPKYASERSQLGTSCRLALAALTSLLVAQFGLGAGAAGAMTAVGLLVPFKVALNAWCKAYESGAHALEPLETEALAALTRN